MVFSWRADGSIRKHALNEISFMLNAQITSYYLLRYIIWSSFANWIIAFLAKGTLKAVRSWMHFHWWRLLLMRLSTAKWGHQMPKIKHTCWLSTKRKSFFALSMKPRAVFLEKQWVLITEEAECNDLNIDSCRLYLLLIGYNHCFLLAKAIRII